MARAANILLVDDHEVNLELLEAYLELSGIPMNIYKAYTCAEAYMCIAPEEEIDKKNNATGQ